MSGPAMNPEGHLAYVMIVERAKKAEQENERLRLELIASKPLYSRRQLKARIDAALTLLGPDECACDEYTGEEGCDFCQIRKVLKGEGGSDE